MSLKLDAAARQAYDALGPRGPRDRARVAQVEMRLRELVAAYRLGGHEGPGGATFVFWTEVDSLIRAGAFDDLRTRW